MGRGECRTLLRQTPVSESGLWRPGAGGQQGLVGQHAVLSHSLQRWWPRVPLLVQFHGSWPPPVAFEIIRGLVTTLLKTPRPVANTPRLSGSKNDVKNCNVMNRRKQDSACLR